MDGFFRSIVMTQLPTKPELPRPADAEGISNWSRTYAQNRRMGIVARLCQTIGWP